MPVDFDALVNAPLAELFGRGVTYTPSGGDPVEVTGIFQAQHQTVETEGELTFSSTAPVLWIRLADWPQAPARFDGVIVDAAAYIIEDVRPDGQGGVKLILKRAA